MYESNTRFTLKCPIVVNLASNMASDPMSSYTRWNQETESVKESTKKAIGAAIHSARSGQGSARISREKEGACAQSYFHREMQKTRMNLKHQCCLFLNAWHLAHSDERF